MTARQRIEIKQSVKGEFSFSLGSISVSCSDPKAEIFFHGLAFCPFSEENPFIQKKIQQNGKVEALHLSICDSDLRNVANCTVYKEW